MIYERVFEKLGLTPNEGHLYVTLLKLGPSPSGTIIKKTGFQSSVVYHLLHSLMEKGIVSFTTERKKKIFVAADPSALEELIVKKKEELDSIQSHFKELANELESFRKKKQEEQTVTVFRGYKGVQTIMDDVLRNAKSYDVYATRNSFTRAMPKYREYVREMRLARKVRQRVIVASNERVPNRPYQEKKYISEEFASPVGLTLYNEKVAIFIWDADPPVSILLQGKKVSKAFKAIFETMWKQAQP